MYKLKYLKYKKKYLNLKNNLKGGGNNLQRQQLWQAININNIQRIQELITENRDLVNITNSEGITPLFKIAEMRNLDLINFLIENGADIYHLNNSNETILFYISQNLINLSNEHLVQTKDIIEFFVRQDVDVDIRNNLNQTALHLVTNQIINDKILKNNSNTEDTNKINIFNTRFNIYEDILRLLSNDRNILFRDENNNTVLDLSRENRYLRSILFDIVEKK